MREIEGMGDEGEIDRKPTRKERERDKKKRTIHVDSFFFLEPSLQLCSQLGMDERVCWMMELLGPGGGCSAPPPPVPGSDMKLWAAARGPALPESCVDKDEAAAALAPAPVTTHTHTQNGLDGLLISVWTNRLLHLLLFDVFQGHGGVCVGCVCSHLQKCSVGMIIAVDFDRGLRDEQGVNCFIFVYQCFSRGSWLIAEQSGLQNAY